MRGIWFVGAMAVVAASAGCVDKVGTELAQLWLEHRDGSLEGELTGAAAEVGFSASELSAGEVRLSIEVGGHALDVHVDRANGWLESDGHGATLTADHRAALASLAEALTRELGPALDPNGPAGSVITAATYWSQAPANFAIAGRSLSLASGKGELASAVGNDGVHCLKKWRSNWASWNAATSTYREYGERVTVGSNFSSSYGCMGRCGAGCSGIGGGWTQDCLDHDTCSFYNNSSGGSGDPNCGDEFVAAEDDFWGGGSCNGNWESQSCGDGVCGSSENAANCATDCGGVPGSSHCGNLVCDSGENSSNCPFDCGSSGCTACPSNMFDGGQCSGTGNSAWRCVNGCFVSRYCPSSGGRTCGWSNGFAACR